MPKLTFLKKDGNILEVEAPAGLSVMEIAQKNKIDEIEGACGGSLSCATCHSYIHPDWYEKTLPDTGEKSEEEEDMLDLAFELRPTSRLCCQIRMKDDYDGLIVAVPGAKTDW
jgi:2Fe-2S ferredoxin